MQNILFENHAATSKSLILYAMSLISIFLGIYIVISKNPIFSILFLIGLFFCISIYLIVIGLHFIGLSYLLIYVGAVSILFLFIIMLINIRVSELLSDSRNSIPLATLTLLLFNFAVSDSLPSSIYIYDVITVSGINVFTATVNSMISSQLSMLSGDVISLIIYHLSLLNVGNVSSKSWDAILVVSSHITSIGNILYTNLFILFIILSLILLLAMVGAIVITVNKSIKKTEQFN